MEARPEAVVRVGLIFTKLGARKRFVVELLNLSSTSVRICHLPICPNNIKGWVPKWVRHAEFVAISSVEERLGQIDSLVNADRRDLSAV